MYELLSKAYQFVGGNSALFAQFSSRNLSTRLNSRVLFATSVQLSAFPLNATLRTTQPSVRKLFELFG